MTNPNDALQAGAKARSAVRPRGHGVGARMSQNVPSAPLYAIQWRCRGIKWRLAIDCSNFVMLAKRAANKRCRELDSGALFGEYRVWPYKPVPDGNTAL